MHLAGSGPSQVGVDGQDHIDAPPPPHAPADAPADAADDAANDAADDAADVAAPPAAPGEWGTYIAGAHL